MSGSTSTVWSFPLTLRVNFWAMSACPPGDGAGLPAGWNPGADARTRGLRPAGTLIQAAVDWNGCNDEILDEIWGADRPPLKGLVGQQSNQFSSPLPLAGEGQGGGTSTAQTRYDSPLPNPPPQAGEGAKKPIDHGRVPAGAARRRPNVSARHSAADTDVRECAGRLDLRLDALPCLPFLTQGVGAEGGGDALGSQLHRGLRT